MPLHLLLLLILLGPGSSLQLWGAWEDGAKGAPVSPLARGRRQAATDDDLDEDYVPEGTDPPEILENNTKVVAFLTTEDMLGRRASMGPGALSMGATTRAAAGLEAGGTALGEPSTGLASQWPPATMELATREAPPAEKPLSIGLATTQALSLGPVATEAEATPPAATEAETTPPATTEAETTSPVATEAETTPPATTEAETTPPAATEAETTSPVATEAETTPPAATEAETTPPVATETETTPPGPTKEASPPAATEEAATEALPMGPRATVALSIIPTTVADFLVSSVTYKDATGTASNLADIGAKKGQLVPTGGSVSPSPTGVPDSIPVRQCLLAILILALVATIFLVCTVVLAVRLSRKSHMYPVRNYSPTEMVCISALLPDGGEGAPGTANGGLPKHQGPKAEPGDHHDGDDLTLHSFLP